MKRVVLTIATVFMMSSTVWGQAVTTAQSAERAERDKENAKLAKERKLDLQVRQPGTAQYYSSVGGYNFQLSNTHTADPFSALQVASGTWWNDPDTVTRLSLTKDQQRKMDDIFQQFRLKLIDLNAALAKEELIMTSLIESERLDEVKILPQIDKVAQARAELEKANSRMLLSIRQTLTMEQWSKIQSSPRKKFTLGRQF